jgi:hypothetical protein
MLLSRRSTLVDNVNGRRVYGTRIGNLLHTNYSIMCKKILSHHNLKDPFRNFVDFMMPRTSGGDYVHKSYIVFYSKSHRKEKLGVKMSVKLIRKVELEIGGQVVESQSGEAMYSTVLEQQSDSTNSKPCVMRVHVSKNRGDCSLDLFFLQGNWICSTSHPIAAAWLRVQATRTKQMIHGDVEEIWIWIRLSHVWRSMPR